MMRSWIDAGYSSGCNEICVDCASTNQHIAQNAVDQIFYHDTDTASNEDTRSYIKLDNGVLEKQIPVQI